MSKIFFQGEGNKLSMVNKQKIFLAFLWLLVMIPPIILGSLIWKYSVNVLILDQLDVSPYLYRYFTHSPISFQELIGQHNESRPLFPRLISIALASFTHWNVRYEMLVTFLFACIIAFNIYLLNRLVLVNGRSRILWVTLILNILIFSPVQYENWLWGFQFLFFIPMVCITYSFLLIYSRFNAITKLIGCICLSTISTFSFANGLLCWIVVSPVLAFKNWQELLKKKWLIIAWISSFLFNIGLYFWNYKKPSQHPTFSYAILHPLTSLEYFLSYLGAPFCVEKQYMAKFIGILLVIIFGAVCTYLWKFRKDYTLWDKMIIWLMIVFYTILSDLITTIGRVGFGVEQAFAPRYTSISLYFAISLIVLVIIVINDLFTKKIRSKKKQNLLLFPILFLGSYLLIIQIFSGVNSLELMGIWRTERLQGKSCLLFINIVEEKECLEKKIYPDVQRIKLLIPGLNDIGFIQPSLIKTSIIQDIESKEKITVDNYGYGWFDGLKKEKNNSYFAWGWARLPGREEPADAVILTYEDPKKGDIAFAISDTRTERPDVIKATQKDEYLMSGWQKSFDASKLPKGDLKIKAWAFDSNTGKVFKLNIAHILKNSKSAQFIKIRGNPTFRK